MKQIVSIIEARNTSAKNEGFSLSIDVINNEILSAAELGETFVGVTYEVNSFLYESWPRIKDLLEKSGYHVTGYKDPLPDNMAGMLISWKE